MQVVANTPLLARADFKNLFLQTPPLGYVASDAFHFHLPALMLDKPRAGFEPYASDRAGDKIPFHGGGRGAVHNVRQPAARIRTLLLDNKVQQGTVNDL